MTKETSLNPQEIFDNNVLAIKNEFNRICSQQKTIQGKETPENLERLIEQIETAKKNIDDYRRDCGRFKITPSDTIRSYEDTLNSMLETLPNYKIIVAHIKEKKELFAKEAAKKKKEDYEKNLWTLKDILKDVKENNYPRFTPDRIEKFIKKLEEARENTFDPKLLQRYEIMIKGLNEVLPEVKRLSKYPAPTLCDEIVKALEELLRILTQPLAKLTSTNQMLQSFNAETPTKPTNSKTEKKEAQNLQKNSMKELENLLKETDEKENLNSHPSSLK